MGGSSERLWVSLINSNRVRRFTASSLAAPLLRSRAAQKLNMTRRYVTSLYQIGREPALFRDLRTCCIFIGHTKTGSSMLGGMLDAHPNMIIADGADALQYVPLGFRKEQLFHILLKCSRREAMKGRVTARRLSPYSFEVPDQWQGRYTTLQVIGDTTSETAVRRLASDPALFDDLQRMMRGVDLKFVHLVRNPFDPISVMRIRGKRSIENAVDRYFETCEMLVQARKQIDPSKLLMLRYEDVIRSPEQNLTRLCGYLGVAAGDDYLKACVSILHKTPDRTRERVPWTPEWIAAVERKIAQVDFLEGYSFEN